MRRGVVFVASALGFAAVASSASSVTTSDNGDSDIRDVRDIVLEERLPPFVLTGGLLILAVVALALTRRHARCCRGALVVCAPATSSGMYELEQLRKAIGDGQRSRGSLAIELDRVVRATLSAGTTIRAWQCSSAELARGVAPHLDEQMRDDVRGHLELLDHVKFAGHEPDPVETDIAFDIAERLVDAILPRP